MAYSNTYTRSHRRRHGTRPHRLWVDTRHAFRPLSLIFYFFCISSARILFEVTPGATYARVPAIASTACISVNPQRAIDGRTDEKGDVQDVNRSID